MRVCATRPQIGVVARNLPVLRTIAHCKALTNPTRWNKVTLCCAFTDRETEVICPFSKSLICHYPFQAAPSYWRE